MLAQLNFPKIGDLAARIVAGIPGSPATKIKAFREHLTTGFVRSGSIRKELSVSNPRLPCPTSRTEARRHRLDAVHRRTPFGII
jgi:hypothetical protein